MSETRFNQTVALCLKKKNFSEHGYTSKLLSQKIHFKTPTPNKKKILTDKYNKKSSISSHAQLLTAK